MQFIDLSHQYRAIQEELHSRFADILTHSRFIMGAEVREIEKVLAEYVGTRHAIACASGTDGLQIACMALGLRPGDEVITTPFTFFATAEVLILLGLKPVFVDIDPGTYHMDAVKAEAAITTNTKAILPVSLYGQCVDMDAINAIGNKYAIPVIEDAAQSFGAIYKGKRSCGLSTIGVTSFFPSKPLGCYGDGGMMFTNDDALAARLRRISNHGQERRYYHTELGVNSRLDTLQAAVLLAKMNIFPEEVTKRRQIGERYTHLLKDVVKTQAHQPGSTHVYAQYTIEVEGDRDGFCQRMEAKGVPTAVHYPLALPAQPLLQSLGYRAEDFPVAERAAKQVVSLPMHPYLDEQTQHQIVDAVKACL